MYDLVLTLCIHACMQADFSYCKFAVNFLYSKYPMFTLPTLLHSTYPPKY